MGHVEMDPRPGRAFVWEWGVWKDAAPVKSSHAWRGKVLDAVPGSTLVLGGGGAAATITVKGEGATSLLTVVHMSASATAAEDFQYGWADFLLRLKTRLEQIPAEDSIYHRMLVRAKPKEVIAAWLSAATMSKILPGKVKLQARAGGAYEWKWKDAKRATASGRFLEIVKGHRVAFTWEPGEVRLSAEETPYGALVSLEHRGLPPQRTREQERMWAHLLERMRVYFYFGKKIRNS